MLRVASCNGRLQLWTRHLESCWWSLVDISISFSFDKGCFLFPWNMLILGTTRPPNKILSCPEWDDMSVLQRLLTKWRDLHFRAVLLRFDMLLVYNHYNWLVVSAFRCIRIQQLFRSVIRLKIAKRSLGSALFKWFSVHLTWNLKTRSVANICHPSPEIYVFGNGTCLVV